jgi:hypothetical protein
LGNPLAGNAEQLCRFAFLQAPASDLLENLFATCHLTPAYDCDQKTDQPETRNDGPAESAGIGAVAFDGIPAH